MSLFTDKCKKYIPLMMNDLNITKVQACGIFGNLGAETGGFTALQEKSPLVKGSKGGWGWMQWTGPRRRKAEAWWDARNMDKSADDANYQYLIFESLNDEKASLISLRKTTTLEAATETFMLKNLRPGIPHLEVRYRWAHKAWDAVKDDEVILPIPSPKKDPISGPATAAVGLGTTLYLFWSSPYFWPVVIGLGLLVIGISILIHKHKNRKL